MAVKTYDPSKCIVAFGPLTLSGFTKGTFVSVDYDEALWAKTVGIDGVSRSKNTQRTATATVTLDSTSPANLELSALAAADNLTGLGALPFTVKEGNSVVFAAEAWIQNTGSFERGAEISQQVWEFALAVTEILPGGN